jgi:hypothetical protein
MAVSLIFGLGVSTTKSSYQGGRYDRREEDSTKEDHLAASSRKNLKRIRSIPPQQGKWNKIKQSY